MAEHTPTEKILHLSKKLNEELESLPIHSHIGVVNVLMQLCTHRGRCLEAEMAKKLEDQERIERFGAVGGVKH